MAEPDSLQQAIQAGVRLLAMREHSARELRAKLERSFEPPVVEAALEELRRQGLQSDQRFTEQYVHSRRNKGYGPLRIRAELRERGIDEATIDLRLEACEGDWRELMLRVARRRFGSDPPKDRREMGRRGRFLTSRGFPSHLVNGYLFSQSE